jgi:hypothetical protein
MIDSAFRANIVGPLRSATSMSACIAACHSSASCSATDAAGPADHVRSWEQTGPRTTDFRV